MPESGGKLRVLAIQPITAAQRAAVEKVDPGIELIDAGGWFDGEIRQTWPAFTVGRYLPPRSAGRGTREERDRLLAEAEVVLGGWPYPLDLRARSPGLRWFHQRPAGASNLKRGDLWGSDVMVTTSRGYGNTLPIAEYVVACALHFAKGLYRAGPDARAGRFGHTHYRPRLLHGKTMCVVGVGGIGRDVGRLAAALGMRVVGTRRAPDGAAPPPGFERVDGPAGLLAMLAESDFVAVCAQWTEDNTNLIGADAFAAMPDDAVLINVARGELVDEGALGAALAAGRLRGAALDVYVGEFERPPPVALWDDPRVLLTPHTSAMSDENLHRAIDLFCRNLRAYLDGAPLENVIDWSRGY